VTGKALDPHEQSSAVFLPSVSQILAERRGPALHHRLKKSVFGDKSFLPKKSTDKGGKWIGESGPYVPPPPSAWLSSAGLGLFCPLIPSAENSLHLNPFQCLAFLSMEEP